MKQKYEFLLQRRRQREGQATFRMLYVRAKNRICLPRDTPKKQPNCRKREGVSTGKERGTERGVRERERERSGKTRQDYKCVSSNSQKFPFYCSFSSSLSRLLCLCENVCLFMYLWVCVWVCLLLGTSNCWWFVASLFASSCLLLYLAIVMPRSLLRLSLCRNSHTIYVCLCVCVCVAPWPRLKARAKQSTLG